MTRIWKQRQVAIPKIIEEDEQDAEREQEASRANEDVLDSQGEGKGSKARGEVPLDRGGEGIRGGRQIEGIEKKGSGKEKEIKVDVREEILTLAIQQTCGVKEEIYGPPMISLKCTAALFNTYRSFTKEGIPSMIRVEDVAIFNALQKISRIATGQVHIDNYVDAAAYMAIAGEAAALLSVATKTREDPEPPNPLDMVAELAK